MAEKGCRELKMPEIEGWAHSVTQFNVYTDVKDYLSY